ncbi:MAG: hypothetical protein PHQ53_04080 [Candidatus Krumholzibacteria bacterium]|nr:hypothetical protein [Candidatus Krumholzibacteria bacterium]
MARQTTLWTALPNGYSDDGRSLRVSLLISPRLEPDFNPHLESFPDFVDWPETLAQSRFVVHFDGPPPVSVGGHDFEGPTRIDDGLGVPDSSVWTALFPKTTFVRGFKFRDLSQHAVLSYPAADMDGLVRSLYSHLAASASDQLPTASTFLDDPDWTALLNAVARNDEQFIERKYDRKTGRLTAIRDVRKQFAAFTNRAFANRNLPSDLARFQLFHTPPSTPKTDKYNVAPDDAKSRAEWLGYEQTKLPKPDDFRNEIDFHQIVAAMNQYPTLLRRLGLVVDLLIARDAFHPAPDALLWVEVELPPGFPTVERLPTASPRTHTLLNAGHFQPVPRTHPKPGDFRVADGLLDLDPKTFSFVQTDVDGSGIKVTNFARSLLTLRGAPDQQLDPVTKQKREIGAPALRNAGLVLVHNQRADMLKNSIARQGQFNAAAQPELSAEDLVRGYRIDIWDDVSKRWHSLCQRTATYAIDNGAVVIAVPDEEGTVRLAATTSPDPASNPDIIWLHEMLVVWPGWSLCAPAPGRTIAHDPTDHTDPVTDAEPEAPPGLRLKSAFKALAGSLPRLRYGRKYWLRARVVDLAGNSLELLPKDFGPEKSKSNARPYFRYEPISAPVIALVKPTPATTDAPAEGESMERMAVRSFNDTPPLNTVPTPQRARRVAVPSRTTQREAEQHGMLDNGGIVDPAFFAMLAAKDNSLAEEKLLAGGAPVETGYAVMVDGDALPYLPDPLAVEIAARIFDHPNIPDTKILSIPLYDSTNWPDALPFKIEIYDDPGDTPHYDSAARTLFIPLPKAARCTLRLSVQPSTDALKILGVWNWLTAAQQTKTIVINGHPTTLETLTHRGQHWMLTPWRNIELVHAVQRPLITPEITKLVVDRQDDATFALPNCIATCSIASTDRIDLRANWNEPFEDAAANQLENRARIDHAFSVKITDAKSYAAFPEYLPQGPDLIGVGGMFHDRLGKKIHEFHNTRYRRIEYWIEATTKFREFMPASLLTEVVGGATQPTEANIKVVGPKVRTWIPCSGPPPAPEVLYVVPTFGWVRSGDAVGKSSWRRGGGLRVYLNRPWNASGYGEMLAVVLPGAGFTGDPNDSPAAQPLKNFVTQWGNDPIWLSPFVPGAAPKPANFPLARTAADPDGKWLPAFAPPEEADQPLGPFQTTALEHPELRSPTAQNVVDIAPHDVFFDEERQLWYCDIEVTWGAAYFPFIRLALARYQPVALHAAHLSNVVLADFMPLVPDRWLNVTQTHDPRTRQVNVFGHTFTDSSSHREAVNAPAESLRLPDGTILDLHAPNVAPSSVVEVWVERFDPALGEDFGWRREPDAIVQHAGAQPRPRPLSATTSTPNRARVRATDLLRHREFQALIDEGLIDHIFVTPTLWEGTVTLPQAPGGTARYRLAIAEYEEYLVDDAMPYDRIPTKKDRRLVFIEHVELG